ncbi:MAG: ABC transporter permease, partial [Candidatus Contubernalis sp.]|nr:ABC transporter permease [Candidatus Contubernalis sp.]
MNGIIEIGIVQLFAAYIFLVILLVITRRQGIGKEKEILISSLRMTIQLIIMGYVLVYIFQVNHYLLSIGALVFMEYFAIRNIYSRIKVKINLRLRKVISLSMISGTSLT